jgi:hypothetical protein
VTKLALIGSADAVVNQESPRTFNVDGADNQLLHRLAAA